MPFPVSAQYSVKRFILAVFVKTSDFDYTLPPGLIAQIPIEPRDRSRLLVLNREDGSIEHRRFFEITDYLHQGDVLVCNDSRVIPARLKGHRLDSGGKVEVLLLRRVSAGLWEALVRPGRRLRVGSKIEIPAEKTLTAEITEVGEGGIRRMKFSDEALMIKSGEVPRTEIVASLISFGWFFSITILDQAALGLKSQK